MPSLRIIYDVERWAYHRRALALHKHAPSEFDVSLASLGWVEAPGERLETVRDQTCLDRALGETAPDLILLLPRSATPAVRAELDRRGWRSKLISSWNSGWPRWIEIFHSVYRASDAMIINNRAYWDMTGRLPGTHLLINGVDLELFKVTSPITGRKPRVLWLGAEMARHRKGYEQLLRPLEAALTANGIACDLRLIDSIGGPKVTAEELAEWYNSGTVLVCASSTEGTPNPALEAAACGCTIVSTAVGNMVELIRDDRNGYLVAPTLDALFEGVRRACKNYERLARRMQEDIQDWAWARRSVEFFSVFRGIAEANSPKQPRPSTTQRPDYTKDLTVFVSTVGAPSFQDCLTCLEQQDCTFRLKVIDHVAPLSAAFQLMLDDCATPFYIQVDEDMILHPHAVRTLYRLLKDEAEDVAILIARLYDPHLDVCLRGFKIYRHEIVRDFPYEDVESCERDQVRRLSERGFRVVKAPPEHVTTRPEEALGLHGTQWTCSSIYERYLTLGRKLRRESKFKETFGDYPQTFLRRFLEEPSQLNFFALMGVVAGRCVSLDGCSREKDYRKLEESPGLGDARRLYQSLVEDGSC